MANIFKKIVIGLAIACLTACAPMIWDKPGTTQEQYNQDSYACEKDARQSGYFGTGLAGALNQYLRQNEETKQDG